MTDVAMERERAKPLGVRAVAAHAGSSEIDSKVILMGHEIVKLL